MRIIAGEHRGRPIEGPPPGRDTTRPITDRAKQSLFDILARHIPGSRVADLFSGTGSMGLECLSRGAEHAVFFEADRAALAALRRNLTALKLIPRSTVVPGDLFTLAPPLLTPDSLEIAFLDPPYRFLTEQPQPLQRLAEVLATALKPQGLVVFRHAAADRLSLAPHLAPIRTLTYGSMTIELLRPRCLPSPPTDPPIAGQTRQTQCSGTTP